MRSEPRLGIVHRLDKETSGVLLIAKTPQALEKLSRQFEERQVSKIYRAILLGRMEIKTGEIEGSIGRDFTTLKMAVLSSGRFAKTDFKVLKAFPRHTYVEAYPKTGRTHQIRVHFAKIGFPVLGDRTYAEEPGKAKRHMLHAYQITFKHPQTGKNLTITAPMPEDFQKILKTL